MGHGNEIQTPVVNPEQAVPFVIQTADISIDLFIGGGVSEPQISVFIPQGFEVFEYFLAVFGLNFPNGNGSGLILQRRHPPIAAVSIVCDPLALGLQLLDEPCNPILHAFILRVNPV